MAKWKKSFKSIPPKTKAKIDTAKEDRLRVVAGKKVDTADIEAGAYAHLKLTDPSVDVGNRWEVVPDPTMGTRSKRNSEGWEVIRKDLPKYTKYFYHDIQNFGDGSTYGWSTVGIPREIYHRDSFPPYLFHIEVEIKERLRDGSLGVVFRIDESFDRTSETFSDDILFAINLLQENTGVHDISEDDDPDIIFTGELSWQLFPPGDVDEVIGEILKGSIRSEPPDKDEVRQRLELFEEFEPTQYLKGLGGNDHYVGAKYTDDLVVFENFKHGNALYVLYEDWEALSQLPRRDILRLPTSKFDRIIHTEGWQNRFAVLMQNELSARNIRIRIGRNRTRYRKTG